MDEGLDVHVDVHEMNQQPSSHTSNHSDFRSTSTCRNVFVVMA